MAQTATPSLGFQNKFSTTLSSGITATDTTIPLNSLPTPSEGFLVIEPDSSTAWEVIYYTSKTGSGVVCPSVAAGRGQDDSTAQSHSSGATVRMDAVAGMFEVLQNGSALSTGALGSTPFATGWISSVLPAVSSVAANGNRSYNVTFNSTVASYLTPGQRIRTTRTSAAPTQCTSLNGTTQYWVKTSPNKLTFTNNFVVSAWIKLSSYAVGTICSRYSGGNGWSLDVNASGQVRLAGYSGGAGNNAVSQSYQSLPLNKWVHVAAQLDMSTTSVGSTNNYIMIDGVEAANSFTRAGTNPTSLTQAGNLEIGSAAAGTFWSGKIAQVAIYNAKVTQANILATISQGLTGSETSLASAYSFNNSTTDLNTSTPNDLSAGAGSPTATNADSPFGGQADGTISSTLDYGIVTKVSTTVATVQVPEGCTIPTTGGVTSVDMSAWKAPYNMPIGKGKWTVASIYQVRSTKTSPSTNVAYNIGGEQITIPIGEWKAGYRVNLHQGTTTAQTQDPRIDLNTTTATFTATSDFAAGISITAAVTDEGGAVAVEAPLALTAQTTYYLNPRAAFSGTSTTLDLYHDLSRGLVYAELAYL